MRGLVALWLLFALGGCGLILQGHTQTVHISSAPPDGFALVDQSGRETTITTPGEATIARKSDTTLVRVSKDGYFSSCRFLTWRSRPGLIVLDSLPLAIPLLIDVSAGTMPGMTEDVTVPLDPMRPGYKDVLPSNAELWAERAKGTDGCDLPPETVHWARLKARYQEATPKIIATSGVPDRPYPRP